MDNTPYSIPKDIVGWRKCKLGTIAYGVDGEFYTKIGYEEWEASIGSIYAKPATNIISMLIPGLQIEENIP